MRLLRFALVILAAALLAALTLLFIAQPAADLAPAPPPPTRDLEAHQWQPTNQP
jgi:hypothetical protein